MDNNRTKALSLWSDADGFWDMVKNTEEITHIWQTMYASAEQLDALYEAYGQLAVVNMDDSREIKNVVLTIVTTNGLVQTMSTTDAQIAALGVDSITSIPLLRSEILGDTDYVFPQDYAISIVNDAITITWATAAPIVTGTYLAPSISVENELIDQFGNMHWDIAMKDAGIDVATRKNIYHCLMLSGRTMPSRGSLNNALNMISGSEYARFSGKIHISGQEVSITYVNTLYAIRHSGRVYGSETSTLCAGTIISGNIISSISAVPLAGDILEIASVAVSIVSTGDRDGEYYLDASMIAGYYNATISGVQGKQNVMISGNKLFYSTQKLPEGCLITLDKVISMVLANGADAFSYVMDSDIPSGTYSCYLYSPIPMSLNDCYAISGDLIYSCLLDVLPNSGPYSITHALNYVKDSGYISAGETYSTVAADTSLEDGDYVEMYAPIGVTSSLLGWKQVGDNKTMSPTYNYDNYITRNYLQDHGEIYYDSDELCDHDLKVGDAIIAEVGYGLQYPISITSSGDIVVAGEQSGIIDMYGDPISVSTNFEEMETLVLLNAGGESENIIVESGSYDEQTGYFTLIPVSGITLAMPTHIVQPHMARHKHIIIDVDEITYEITTDREIIYGTYTSDCSVIYRRCRDESYNEHLFSIDAVEEVTAPEYKITVTSLTNALSSTSPTIENSVTVIMWSDNVNPMSAAVVSIDAALQTINVIMPDELPAGLVGGSLLYVGGIYTRNKAYINTSSTDEDIKSLLEEISTLMLPSGTEIHVNSI